MAIALDPKVIDMALDIHIDTCLAHVLQFYSSEEEFVKVITQESREIE